MSAEKWKWLEESLEKKNLTQTAAASKVGLTGGAVSFWLNGQGICQASMGIGNNPDDVAVKISSILGASVEDVRYQMRGYLMSVGRLEKPEYYARNLKSEVKRFKERMNSVETLNGDIEFTEAQKQTVLAAISVIETLIP